jgi:hydroxyethylthiazole kinase
MPETSWAALRALRDKRPLVHQITNYVAMEVSANALLAVGGSPAMIHAVEEAADFARIADAVVVNVGTLSPRWVEGMQAAMEAAALAGIPRVLDPVGVGATPYRTREAAALLTLGPTVVRANASEVLALAGDCGLGPATAGQGVDATHDSLLAREAAQALARRFGVIVAVSGPVDLITDGARIALVRNGHPLMARVTALGCALSGLVGGFLASWPDPLEACVAAFVVFGLAGEQAAAKAQGPGSLAMHLLDALYVMDEATLVSGARVEEVRR